MVENFDAPGILAYKLEFLYDETAPNDAAVFIHLRKNVPIYQARINKENYDIIPTEGHNLFLDALFNTAGVVEAATQPFRIWLMKSPVYNWSEVLNPILFFLMTFYGEITLLQMPGSDNVDGSGSPLSGATNRRPTTF